jgi:hypothetical protein
VADPPPIPGCKAIEDQRLSALPRSPGARRRRRAGPGRPQPGAGSTGALPESYEAEPGRNERLLFGISLCVLAVALLIVLGVVIR